MCGLAAATQQASRGMKMQDMKSTDQNHDINSDGVFDAQDLFHLLNQDEDATLSIEEFRVRSVLCGTVWCIQADVSGACRAYSKFWTSICVRRSRICWSLYAMWIALGR